MPKCMPFTSQVVQEYERAVIFRLGRLLKGGAKGPGIFFVIPCIDSYRKIDLRTVSFDVPPQEVNKLNPIVLVNFHADKRSSNCWLKPVQQFEISLNEIGPLFVYDGLTWL